MNKIEELEVLCEEVFNRPDYYVMEYLKGVIGATDLEKINEPKHVIINAIDMYNDYVSNVLKKYAIGYERLIDVALYDLRPIDDWKNYMDLWQDAYKNFITKGSYGPEDDLNEKFIEYVEREGRDPEHAEEIFPNGLENCANIIKEFCKSANVAARKLYDSLKKWMD